MEFHLGQKVKDQEGHEGVVYMTGTVHDRYGANPCPVVVVDFPQGLVRLAGNDIYRIS